jgi:hypothetical protein
MGSPDSNIRGAKTAQATTIILAGIVGKGKKNYAVYIF